MNHKFSELEDKINKELADMQIYVTNIKQRKEGTYRFLTIELDKLGGLDLDTIVEASQKINPIVDAMDLIDDSYILDIISKERKDINE